NGGVAGDGVSPVVLRVPPGFTAGTKWTMTGGFADHNSTAATANALALQSAAITGPLNVIETSLPPGDCQMFILT
ncbi:hypothetical protein, partial [Profundibacterium mesophilum]